MTYFFEHNFYPLIGCDFITQIIQEEFFSFLIDDKRRAKAVRIFSEENTESTEENKN